MAWTVKLHIEVEDLGSFTATQDASSGKVTLVEVFPNQKLHGPSIDGIGIYLSNGQFIKGTWQHDQKTPVLDGGPGAPPPTVAEASIIGD